MKKFPLAPEPDGYFSARLEASAGELYRYRLDGGEAFPDPCSRFQPEGPHGPSQIVDARAFPWTDESWAGLQPLGQILYELHVGAYTQEGTYRALERELPALKELGVTVLELMPLHTCPGRFNWGYDGVALFAPSAMYGTPDDLRHLVDRAHALGLGMILDVVYNHLGPDGNYLGQYAKAYFSSRYPNDWGVPLNFDGEDSAPVREFFCQNAASWVEEFHFDGVRIDATQSLHDASARHIVSELSERIREASPKPVLIISESEPQDVKLVQPCSEGGGGTDAVWVDDFHHACRVALTGKSEAYCQDYRGTAQELLSCALRNSLFQGQWYDWQQAPRGNPLDRVEPRQAVFYVQNHDQIANSLRGARLHQMSSEALTRAITTYLLTLPQTPMLFMGQEFFASSPFLYFVDHEPGLQKQVDEGRRTFLSQFPSARAALENEGFVLPSGEAAFAASRLDLGERETHGEALHFHKEMLRLRRSDPVLSDPNRRLAGATLSPCVVVLRQRGGVALEDRLVLLNLGADLRLDPCPEPLLSPLPGTLWKALLCSEDTRFGGAGGVWPTGMERWFIPGHSALVLSPEVRKP